MRALLDVETATFSLERFEELIRPEQYRQLTQAAREARRMLAGRTIWNVNSTARGGGVAEMLRSLVAYAKGAGLDCRWLVIVPEDPGFFRVTKRIHNHLHGYEGNGGRLDDEAREIYERALRVSAQALAERVEPGDIVLLHDPQTAGMVPAVARVTPHVIWRCHVGLDMPNDLARQAWSFLLPYVEDAHAYVFSRADFAWEGLDRSRIGVIPPSIDPFSPKNQQLSRDQVAAILTVAGIVTGGPASGAMFQREDGTVASVVNRAEMVEVAPVTLNDRLVVQVSRWDRLKDPMGVIRGFVDHVVPHVDAHLFVVGPSVEAVSDDPEGLEVLRESILEWESLRPEAQRHVHLVTLPMVDSEENAAMVNAIQRHAEVIVQKSLAEGFGLTVAEAMWKGRPVVASRIGGIKDQIEHGRTGILIDDARDLAEYGGAVRALLEMPEQAAKMGEAARERVRDYFLGPRHLMQYAELFEQLLAAGATRAGRDEAEQA
jgi:trehalose synthase